MQYEKVEWTDKGLETVGFGETQAPFGLSEREYAHLLQAESRGD